MFEAEWMDIFADNLRDIMMEWGDDQTSLAEAAGITQAALSQYLSKKRMPNLRSIINLSYALDMTIDELIDFGDMLY